MSYDGGCGDIDCELCKADAEANSMKINNDPNYLKKMASKEDGCCVSVGGLIGDIENLSAKYVVMGPGMSGSTNDLSEAQTWLNNNRNARLYRLVEAQPDTDVSQTTTDVSESLAGGNAAEQSKEKNG